MQESQNASIPGLDEWNEVTAANSGVTVEQLDAMVKEYTEAYKKYEEAKLEAKKLNAKAEELEGKLTEALEQAGKSKYYVEDIGTVYFINKLTVPTPKTINEKKLLFKYIKETHGETLFFDKVGVNHQTLQKLYNEDFAEYESKGGDPSLFNIPGLQAPTNMRSLGFRKDR